MFCAVIFSLSLQLTVVYAVGCSPPFSEILGGCLHFSTKMFRFCAAHAYCRSVGGELVRGAKFLPLDGASFPGMPLEYLIGLTDLLDERGANGSGWRWSDGALDPPSSSLSWNTHTNSQQEPRIMYYDCVYQCTGLGNLCGGRCGNDARAKNAMCQPREPPSAVTVTKIFQPVVIPVGLGINFYGETSCSQLLTGVETELECARLCHDPNNGWCSSIYYNKAKKECRIVQYTDSTIYMGNVEGWVKFSATM